MTTSTDGIATPADHVNEPRVAFAARHLYEAELALHDAHQSYVEVWIVAASDKLHQAVVDYLAAVHEQAEAGSSITRSRWVWSSGSHAQSEPGNAGPPSLTDIEVSR